MQPISKSDLICTTCGHLYDKELRVCTCYSEEFKDSEEYIEDGGKTVVRNIIPFKKYLQNKYGGR
jgi:hypothetical protein